MEETLCGESPEQQQRARLVVCPFCASRLLTPAHDRSLAATAILGHVRSSNECPYLPIGCHHCRKRFPTEHLFAIHRAKAHRVEDVIEVGMDVYQ